MTGYTYRLKEMGFDLPRWLKESAVRAMGVCVRLRDSRTDMTEDEIKAGIDGGTSYYEESLARDKERLKEFEAKSFADWEKEYAVYLKEREEDYKQSLKEYNLGKEAFINSLNEVDRLISANTGSPNSVVTGTLRFAKEQIETTLTSFGNPPTPPSKISVAEFSGEEIAGVRRSIKYGEDRYTEQKVRNEGLVGAYTEFVEFVNKNTGDKNGK